MKDKLASVLWRLGIFMAACALGTFALLMVFAQLRFQEENSFAAEFSNASGLRGGDFVRIAGVEVGKVRRVSVSRHNLARVDFTAAESVVLTTGARAVIRYDNLIGGRFLELQEGPGGERLTPGQTIPLGQTAPALDLDTLIGGFRPLFQALDPEQVNALTGQLIRAFQGQAGAVNSLLAQTGTFTAALADRDELIGSVIANLNAVLDSLGGQSDKFGDAVSSLSLLVGELSERRGDISNSIAYSNEATRTVADLLGQARPPLQEAVKQTDRVSTLVVDDHDYFDDLLNTMPDAYRALGRLGLQGDYFTFYLCDVFLKANGKGGQPVYVKLAGQVTGRCAAK